MTTKTTSLTRVTVNLIPRADAALTLAVELTGDSKTDTINRAIQIYAYLEHVKNEGADILLRDKDGTTKLLVLT
jgi:hypothetical protein